MDASNTISADLDTISNLFKIQEKKDFVVVKNRDRYLTDQKSNPYTVSTNNRSIILKTCASNSNTMR